MNRLFKFDVPTPKDFAWEITVRSFGFFLVPPNNYDRESRIFSRPLRVCWKSEKKGEDKEHYTVFDTSMIHDAEKNALAVTADHIGGSKDCPQQHIESQITRQIVRMFRLDADVAPFHKLFPDAR